MTKLITIPRAELERALEALEWCEPAGTVGAGGIAARKAAMASLRDLLAAPSRPAPVGYAGAAVWIGPFQVVQLVTEADLVHERVPGNAITKAAIKCAAMVTSDDITRGIACPF